jgi:hypothetical protein
MTQATAIALEMTILLKRLSRLSDERDQKYADDLIKRWDAASGWIDDGGTYYKEEGFA